MGATPEEVLARARDEGVWGTLTVHLKGGVPTHSVLLRAERPSGNPQLAAATARLAVVRRFMADGATAEIVFVRLRGGHLAHLATEIHRSHQGAGDERDGHPGGAPPHEHQERGAGDDLHHAPDH